MANGPLPTQLTLLADLDSFPLGTKVRFLGCVLAYSTKSAALTLQHNYPPDHPHPLKALVDVQLLLKSLASNEVQVGEWVNVIGYVTTDQLQQASPDGNRHIKIQAIVLWSAKSFDLASYERSLSNKNRIEAISQSEIRPDV